MTPEQQTAVDLQKTGLTRAQIAARMGKTPEAVKSLLRRARKWQDAPSALTDGAAAIGVDTPGKVVWTKTHPDGTVTHSVMHTNEVSDDDFFEVITDSLKEYKPLDRGLFPSHDL